MTENSYTNLYDAIELAYRRESYAQEHFYFSDLGKCFRMRILKRLNIPQYPMDNRGLRVCTMGNQIEKLVINALVKAKILRKAQIPIYFGEFSGRLDAEVIAYEDTRTIECKSIHSGGFHYMLEDEPPHRHYIYQVIGYGLFRGNKFVHLLYVSRDDLCYKEYILPVEKYKQEVVKDMLKLKHYWRKKVLPPAIPYDENLCAYCPFFHSEIKTTKNKAQANLKECKALKSVKAFKDKMKKEGLESAKPKPETKN